jgi:ABC-type glycerol-3-phosphate transport system substrate-binding protein
MRFRRYAVAGVATAALLAAAACGGGGANNNTTAQNTPNASGTNSSKLSGTVSVAAVYTGEEQKAFQKVLANFTKATGVKTTFKSTGDDIATYLGSQVAGGNPPDVALLPQPGLLQSLAQKGNLKPLSSKVEQLLDKNYASYWKQLTVHQGKPYGVYFKAANKSTWWYVPKLFKNAGVKPPKTWNDTLKDAKTVAASGSPYVAIGGGDGWVLTDWFENIYLRQAGPTKYDKLTKHQIPWTDASVTKALKTFRQLLETKGAVLGGLKGAVQNSFTDSVNDVLTANPKAASVYEGDFVPGVANDKNLKPGTSYNVFDFPSVGGSGPAVVGGGDVAVTLTGSKQAQALLAYLASPKAPMPWIKSGGFTSPNKNVPLSAYSNDIQRSIAKGVIDAANAGNLRFDMSDQAPPAFGGTKGRGEWQDMQNFAQHPDNISGVQKQLEKDAKAAYGSSG